MRKSIRADYEDFCLYMAKYGFINCPLSFGQFAIIHSKATLNQAYGIACDVNAGVSFLEAVRVNGVRLSHNA